MNKNQKLEYFANVLGYSIREVRENAKRTGITPIQAIRHLAKDVQTSRGGAAFSDAFYREVHSLLDTDLKKNRNLDRLSTLRSPKKKYWVIVNGSNEMLTYDHNSEQKWKRIPKRSFANGAWSFNTKSEALTEISTMQSLGQWPLMTMRTIQR